MANELPFERPLVELKSKIEELRKFGEEKQMDFSDEISKLEQRYNTLKQELYGNLKAGQKLEIARHPSRPTTLDFIGGLFTDFIELHGDRAFRDDLAIIGGGPAVGKSMMMPANPDLKDKPEVVEGLVRIVRSFGKT